MTKTHALCCGSITIVLLFALPTADANARLSKKRIALYPQADTNGDGILTDAEEDAVSHRALQTYPFAARGRRNTTGAGKLRIGGQSVKTTVPGSEARDPQDPQCTTKRRALQSCIEARFFLGVAIPLTQATAVF